MKTENYQAMVGLAMPISVCVVLLILKLSRVISCSWWWITSPLWTLVLLMFVFLAIDLIRHWVRLGKHNRKLKR